MIQLTKEGLRQIFPRAPKAVIDADWQTEFDKVGLTTTRTRLAFCFANVEHECGGFTIKYLTESIAYSPSRACQVWPSRFHSSSEVFSKIGSYANDPNFRTKLMNYVYGGRMGNRPGTDDGSRYIGRGGPQVTGRDGYAEVGKRCGLDLVNHPELASLPENQPKIIAAFWDWKKLNAKADAGDFTGCVKLWNGGTIGMADRQHQLAGNDPYIQRLSNVDSIMPAAKMLPGKPPTPTPPKEILDEATKNARTAVKASAATAVVGTGSQVTKTGTTQPDKAPLVAPSTAWPVVGVAIAVVIIAVIVISKKKAAIASNWF